MNRFLPAPEHAGRHGHNPFNGRGSEGLQGGAMDRDSAEALPYCVPDRGSIHAHQRVSLLALEVRCFAHRPPAGDGAYQSSEHIPSQDIKTHVL
jgi:hypothetical protein